MAKDKSEKKEKRENGAGTIRERTVTRNGKKYTFWEGTITVGTDDGSGKQLRRTFTGKSQGEVAKKMRAASNAVDEGTYFEASKLTLRQWFDTWLSDYCGDKKYATTLQYRNMGDNHILPALGAVKLCKLTAPHIQKFYNRLAKDRQTEIIRDGKKVLVDQKALSAKTIRNIHGILSKCLNVAIDQGMLKSNPAERVTIPKVTRKEIQPLTEGQQKAFLKAISGHRYQNLFAVILFTGLRESEAIGLTWDCFDEKKGTLKVYRQLQKRRESDGGYVFAPLKNDKTRNITLSRYVVSILKEQRKQQTADRLKAGEFWKGWQDEEERKTGLVFSTELGEHLGIATVWREYKKLVEQAGAPDARVHDLRHTFAVNGLQNGDDVKTVQENLGHATAAFTLDVYGHVSERMKEESARRQQAFIESLTS